jgi:hypothetical protein
LFGPIDESYVALNNLVVAYRGADSGLVIAVNPSVDPDFYGVPRVSASTGFLYDDTSERIEYSGHWVKDTQFQAASNGTLTYSNVPGDRFRFAFEGTAVTLLYTKAFNRGMADVLLDGKPAGTLDMYSMEVQFQRRAAYGPLKAGTHTIEVEVKASKDPKSSNSVVDLDAIEVR